MKERESESTPLSPETLSVLRSYLRAPGGEGYWESLHSGIMSRITGTESAAWWVVLSRWSRPALAAAAVVLLVVSAAMIALDARRADVVYVDVLESQPVPVQTARFETPGSAREATFHFVMSSNGGRAP